MKNKRIYVVTVSELISRSLLFIFIPVISIFMTTGDVAKVTILIPIIQSLQNAISFGSNIYILKFYDDNRYLSGSAFILAIVVSVFLAFSFLFFFNNELVNFKDIFVVFLITLCMACFNQYYASCQAVGEFLKPAFLNVLVRVFIYFIAIFFSLYGISALYGYWVFISIVLLFFLSRAAYFSLKCFFEIKKLLVFGWPVFLNAIVSYANFNLSRLVFYDSLSVEEFATLGLSLVFPQASVLLFAIYSRLLSPSIMSHIYTLSEKRDMIKIAHKKLVLFILLFWFVSLIGCHVLQNVLGYIDGYDSVIISIGFVAFIALSLNAAYTDIIFWKEKAYLVTFNLLFSLLAGFAVTYFLIPMYGIYSFAFGIFASCSIQGITTYLITYRIIKNEKDNIVI